MRTPSVTFLSHFLPRHISLASELRLGYLNTYLGPLDTHLSSPYLSNQRLTTSLCLTSPHLSCLLKSSIIITLRPTTTSQHHSDRRKPHPNVSHQSHPARSSTLSSIPSIISIAGIGLCACLMLHALSPPGVAPLPCLICTLFAGWRNLHWLWPRV